MKPCAICGAPVKEARFTHCSKSCAMRARWGFRDVAERFWSKVDRRGPNECWPWTAGQDGHGRGHFTFEGKPVKAPRIALLLTNGEMPKGDACHSCDNPICVNPAHLRDGTRADNVRDMVNRGRARGQRNTHCVNGHEFTPENTYRRPGSGRSCRTCVNERSRRAQAAQFARVKAGGPARLTERPHKRLTHCKRGHPFSDENTANYMGHRICRKCSALKAQRYRERQQRGASA